MKKFLLSVLASSLLCSTVYAAELAPLKSDTEPDRTDWTQLDSKYGAIPKVEGNLMIGGVSKTLTNEYWRSLGQGYQNGAKKYGFTVAYQAAANEDDQMGQLSIAETMISRDLRVCWFRRRPISTWNRRWKVPTVKRSRWLTLTMR